jgi:hypothetical protein
LEQVFSNCPRIEITFHQFYRTISLTILVVDMLVQNLVEDGDSSKKPSSNNTNGKNLKKSQPVSDSTSSTSHLTREPIEASVNGLAHKDNYAANIAQPHYVYPQETDIQQMRDFDWEYQQMMLNLTGGGINIGGHPHHQDHQTNLGPTGYPNTFFMPQTHESIDEATLVQNLFQNPQMAYFNSGYFHPGFTSQLYSSDGRVFAAAASNHHQMYAYQPAGQYSTQLISDNYQRGYTNQVTGENPDIQHTDTILNHHHHHQTDVVDPNTHGHYFAAVQGMAAMSIQEQQQLQVYYRIYISIIIE